MASITNVPSAQSENIFARALKAIWNGLVSLSEANARSKELDFYNSLTDEQLAERGLKREQIVRYVFRDRLSF